MSEVVRLAGLVNSKGYLASGCGSSGTWCIQALRRSGTHSVDEHGCRGTWRYCGLQVLAENHIGGSRTDLKMNLAPRSNLPVWMNLKGHRGTCKALSREVTGDRSSCWMLAHGRAAARSSGRRWPWPQRRLHPREAVEAEAGGARRRSRRRGGRRWPSWWSPTAAGGDGRSGRSRGTEARGDMDEVAAGLGADEEGGRQHSWSQRPEGRRGMVALEEGSREEAG